MLILNSLARLSCSINKSFSVLIMSKSLKLSPATPFTSMILSQRRTRTALGLVAFHSFAGPSDTFKTSKETPSDASSSRPKSPCLIVLSCSPEKEILYSSGFSKIDEVGVSDMKRSPPNGPPWQVLEADACLRKMPFAAPARPEEDVSLSLPKPVLAPVPALLRCRKLLSGADRPESQLTPETFLRRTGTGAFDCKACGDAEQTQVSTIGPTSEICSGSAVNSSTATALINPGASSSSTCFAGTTWVFSAAT
mmetsp:Transcript_97890/g.276926  ORF Transcript_97890/g.276926 Transcript_97890/m.276926 type:complete len:252 (-) Transcript_97890:236-991(-)